MSNHTIKAKNKNSQEIRDFTIIADYYDSKYQNSYHSGTAVYKEKEFNDLFEVVEDKCDCIEKTCQKDCKKGHTHKTFWCDICCESRGLPKSTPQTEIVEDKFIDEENCLYIGQEGQNGTLKKEDWEKKILKDWKIEYNYNNLKNGFTIKPDEVDFHVEQIAKYWTSVITQEIAKAKEESDKEIIHLTSIIKQLIK